MVRSKIRSLQKKLTRAKENLCTLEKKVKDATSRAAELFVKSEYELLVNPLQEQYKQACDCANKAKDATEAAAKKKGAAASVKGEVQCRDEINAELERHIPKDVDDKKKTSLLVSGWSKNRSEKQKDAIRDCQKGETPDIDALVEEIKEKAKQQGITLNGRILKKKLSQALGRCGIRRRR